MKRLADVAQIGRKAIANHENKIRQSVRVCIPRVQKQIVMRREEEE